MAVQSAKELTVYRKAYELSMRIFQLTRHLPAEERYALTSQIRRSSRSVCLNLREAWAKRRYHAHFVSKLSDCDAELNETDTSLDFMHDCGYVSTQEYDELVGLGHEIGRMLGSMFNNPNPFLIFPKP